MVSGADGLKSPGPSLESPAARLLCAPERNSVKGALTAAAVPVPICCGFPALPFAANSVMMADLSTTTEQIMTMRPDSGGEATYSRAARQFHWITAGFVFVMVPVGIYMVNRGAATNFDALTNTLYANHKMAGFILLWIIVARLAYRLIKGAPPDEPTLEPWQKLASHAAHWGMYGILLAVPLLGWLGVSLYPALGIPFGLSLPALVSPDQKMSETVFMFHKIGGIVLMLLVLTHIGAAMFHHFIRKDGVLRRMIPGLKKG
jgi:cytochrome b561